MQKAQFERIYQQMARDFGTMRKGDEDTYSMILFPMESNALKVHRQYPDSNSRRMREAIALVLWGIRERCGARAVDVTKFRNVANERLEHALLMAFDPYANEEIMKSVGDSFEEDKPTPDELRDYYKTPVKCLLRIKDSIDFWERQYGSDGYFKFFEGSMGRSIEGTDMNYSVLLRKR